MILPISKKFKQAQMWHIMCIMLNEAHQYLKDNDQSPAILFYSTPNPKHKVVYAADLSCLEQTCINYSTLMLWVWSLFGFALILHKMERLEEFLVQSLRYVWTLVNATHISKRVQMWQQVLVVEGKFSVEKRVSAINKFMVENDFSSCRKSMWSLS